jgi:hypothetical protein
VLTKVNRAIHGTCAVVKNNVRYTPPSIDTGFVGWDQCAYIVCSSATNRLGKTFDKDVECDRGRLDVRVESISTEDESIEWDEDDDNDDDYDDYDVNEKELEDYVDEKKQEEEDEKMNTMEEELPNGVQVPRPDRPTAIVVELADNESESSVASVYAADEMIFTLQNTPIKVDVTSNDFSKEYDILLKITQTGGAEHGNCVITSDNNVQYIPEPEFVGLDHCGYIICRSSSVCDEGILAIKVTSLRATHHQSSSDFVSNYESSGGLSLIKKTTQVNEDFMSRQRGDESHA